VSHNISSIVGQMGRDRRLVGRLRDVFLTQAQPRLFSSELPAPENRDHRDPAAIFNLPPAWIELAKQIATRYRMELEDPLAYRLTATAVSASRLGAACTRFGG
jgi:hypothetical protein